MTATTTTTTTINPDIRIARKVTRRVLTELQAAGYTVSGVATGDPKAEPVTSIRGAVAECFAVDEASVLFALKNGRRSWVLIIAGNREDAVSDYSCGDEAFAAVIDRVLDTMDTWLPEAGL